MNERLDNSEKALTQFLDWTNNNRMKCNKAKCKELVITEKEVQQLKIPGNVSY